MKRSTLLNILLLQLTFRYYPLLGTACPPPALYTPRQHYYTQVSEKHTVKMARITSIGMPRKTFVPSAAEEARQPSPEAGPSTAPAEGEEKPKKKVHRSGKKQQKKRERAKAIENGELVLPTPEEVEAERERSRARNAEKVNKQKRKDTGETGAGYVQSNEGGEGGTKRQGGWGRDEGIASESTRSQRGAEGS